MQPQAPQQNIPAPPLAGRLREKVQAAGLRVIQQEEEIIKHLMPDAAPERGKYPESEFRQHFLPVISGEAEKNLPPGYTVERLRNEAFQYWATIANGVSKEVEIIDANGEVAFIVPALADTAVLDTRQDPNRPGLKILQEEVLKDAQGRPDVANARLLSGLEQKIATMVSARTGDRKRTLERLAAMHAYYGLKPESGATSGQGSAGSSGSFMGEMSFD